MSVLIETTGSAYVATNVDGGGCTTTSHHGIIFVITRTLSGDGLRALYDTMDITSSRPVVSGPYDVEALTWYSLNLINYGDHVDGYIDGVRVLSNKLTFAAGFAAIGSSYDYVMFDNFVVEPVTKQRSNSVTTTDI